MGVYSHDFGNLQLGFMGGIEHGQWVILVFFPVRDHQVALLCRSPGLLENPPLSLGMNPIPENDDRRVDPLHYPIVIPKLSRI
jgi:hypothetical protein